MSPRPGGDVANSSEFAVMGSGEYRGLPHRDKSATAVALRFLREHTGLALLLTYLAVTVVARMHDVWFYGRFNVNILYYSNSADLFLAPMRNPVTWLFFVAPLGIMLLISWLMKRRKRLSKSVAKWNTPTVRLIAASLLVILSAGLLTRIHADRRATSVRAGLGRHVSFTRTDGVKYDEDPLLLGSTGQFFFLYYAKRRVAEIVPVENTALMTINLRPGSDPGTVIPTVGGSGNTPPPSS